MAGVLGLALLILALWGWRWLSSRISAPRTLDTETPFPANTSPRPPLVPPEIAGFERHESRSHPGRYYYRNAIPAPLPDLPCIHGDALFGYEVVGESHYQRVFETIVGGHYAAPIYFRAVAVLSAEPDNPHDSNAIAIRINGEKVGYVRMEDSVSLRRQLNENGVSGDVQCRAEIGGGWNYERGDVGMFGLKLDLTFPLDVRPRRKPPAPKQSK